MLRQSERFVARAKSVVDRSDGIVVSFDFGWYEAITQGQFSAIIRKKVPTSVKPKWLYLHVNTPKSSVCARAEIISIERVSRSRACEIQEVLHLSKKEIENYFCQSESVGCYYIGNLIAATREIGVRALCMRMDYHPPQSFFILSLDGKRILDEMCGFGVALNSRD